MPVDDEAAQIARGLTRAQREAVTVMGQRDTWHARSRLDTMTVLKRKGLIEYIAPMRTAGGHYGPLTEKGLRVRAALEAIEQEKNDG